MGKACHERNGATSVHARLLTRTRETPQGFSLVLARYAILRTPTGKRPVALARLRKMMEGTHAEGPRRTEVDHSPHRTAKAGMWANAAPCYQIAKDPVGAP